MRDTDFAKETTNLTKQSILKEVGTSLLAQAKDYPRNAVSLLS
ncbi:flagellin [Vibrio parahaemolyticus]|nr:flagellin [Vibrio parahaemolyticus]